MPGADQSSFKNFAFERVHTRFDLTLKNKLPAFCFFRTIKGRREKRTGFDTLTTLSFTESPMYRLYASHISTYQVTLERRKL